MRRTRVQAWPYFEGHGPCIEAGDGLMRSRDRRRPGWRAAVIALSLSAHLALLAALLSTLVYLPLPAPPVIQVQLMPAPSPERSERAEAPVEPAPSAPPARAPSLPVFRADPPSAATPSSIPAAAAVPPRPTPAQKRLRRLHPPDAGGRRSNPDRSERGLAGAEDQARGPGAERERGPPAHIGRGAAPAFHGVGGAEPHRRALQPRAPGSTG